jgi:hypothetical protein
VHEIDSRCTELIHDARNDDHKISIYILLRKLLGPKRSEITGEWKNMKMRSFMFVLLVTYYWMVKIKDD